MVDSDEDSENSSSETVDLSQLTLEEARLRFQEESERRNSAESKIGTLLTVDAIIISVVGLFSNLSFLLIVAMTVALISVIVGIHGLRVQDYRTPGKEIDDYLQYIDDPPQPIRRKLAISYITAISGNEETDDQEKFFKGNRTKNDEKYRNLFACQVLTVISLLLVLAHSGLTLLC